MSIEHLDVERALSGLKDFQRRTVDYVFQRMWLDPVPTPRFLVADEVGLGKTLVARGIIAKTLEHLADRIERIDVVYICSNAAIAQQNVNRLNVLGDQQFAVATRLTLLPLQLHELENNRVNFVSFTPGTTFDLKSSGGIWRERVVLHRLLTQELPHLARPLVNVLRGQVGVERFRERVRDRSRPLNEALGRSFLQRLRQNAHLMDRLHDVTDRFRRHRDKPSPEDAVQQYSLIGKLRQLLAHVCVEALQPDLVILDEFQRFRDLLTGDSEAAELAKELMHYTTPEGDAVRVLLLSATPYKAVTLSAEDEDHYSDFLTTLGFLFQNPARIALLEEHLRTFRRGLYSGGDEDLEDARHGAEALLRSVMVRTERVGHTQQQDAMLTTTRRDAPLHPTDLSEARLLDLVARGGRGGEAMDYWKSAPHVLQFMKKYQLKLHFTKLVEDGEAPAEMVDALREAQPTAISRSSIGRYRELAAGNGRMRVLLDDMVSRGQWQLLWVHPSLPYLQPGGVFATVPDFTKALVFSAWTVVPDAIAVLCSYEVERRMVTSFGDPPQYPLLLKSRRPLLRFAESGGRLTGMPALALLYPSIALARAVDPLRLSLELGDGEPAPVEAMRARAREEIVGLLERTAVWSRSVEGAEDERWYWAAPAILDRTDLRGQEEWLTALDGPRRALGGKEEDRGLLRHLEQFRLAVEGKLDEELGRPPEDLPDVLVDLALGGPGVCALRALSRLAPRLPMADRDLAYGAACIANGLRTLFNQAESISLLRGEEEEAYWRLVLEYGIDGNLQAVLDEYAHYLREALGLMDHPAREVVRRTSGGIADALSFRSAQLTVDDIGVTPAGATRIRDFRVRTRYAVRFGDLIDEQEEKMRTRNVQAAFNSPFRPFVLASTSIGQEGLDFHPYCHAVYHWNLPSNPVDLEQREGRVHRYKGHAVRKNVARRWGLRTLQERLDGHLDPWEVLFAVAAENRTPGANELEPYWIYPGEASVERRVPIFPLSREVSRLAALQRSLAVYRLAFGQPRQEDLLTFLARDGGDENGAAQGRISLEPPVLRDRIVS